MIRPSVQALRPSVYYGDLHTEFDLIDEPILMAREARGVRMEMPSVNVIFVYMLKTQSSIKILMTFFLVKVNK